MATDINIAGRLHSMATGNVVAGSDEILDDTLGKKQSVINEEVGEELTGIHSQLGTGGTVDERIASAVAAGVASEAGARQAADMALAGQIGSLETAVGTGGSVDQRINAAKTEIIGGASSEYNTLGKTENKILSEAGARAYYDEALRQLYENLVQSGVTPMSAEDWEALEEAPGFPDNGSLSEQVIYRVAGDESYSDKMYYVDPVTQVGRVLTMATYDNAIDDVPTYDSDNIIKSKAIFDEKLYSQYDSLSYIPNKSFSINNGAVPYFLFIDSDTRNTVVVRYKPGESALNIPGIDTSSNDTWWFLMKEWDVWEYSNYITYYRGSIPIDLRTVTGLGYIGISYLIEENFSFDPKTIVNWIKYDDSVNAASLSLIQKTNGTIITNEMYHL